MNKLEGLLKWSLSQSDGTKPARQITDEERKWFQEAMSANTIDIVQRMKEIALVMGLTEESLLQQGVTVDELEGLLEELQEHVESIDMANDLKAIGGLNPLLAFLKSPHAKLRARAAEVIMTMVQNNEKSQRQVMEAGGHLTLFDLFQNDPDATVRAKVTGAISSLIQHNAEGTASFRSVVGLQGLLAALSTSPSSSSSSSSPSAPSDPRLLRKILVLSLLLLQQSPADKAVAVRLGFVRTLASDRLLCSDSADVRAADRQLLQELTPAVLSTPPEKPSEEEGAKEQENEGQVAKEDSVASARTELLEALQRRIQTLSKNQHSGADAEEEEDGHEELAGLLKLRRQVLEGAPVRAHGREVAVGEQGRRNNGSEDGADPPAPLLIGAPPRA